MSKVQQVIDIVKEMNVLELSELVKIFKEEFGVTDTVPVSAAPAAPAEAVIAEEEKTEFDVVLTDIGGNKIGVIKVVRDLTGLGLKEAKELVEGSPQKVKEAVSKEIAEEVKVKLEEVGAKAEIK